MERGDLAVSVRPHYVVVLEGVLCTVEPIIAERRFRSDKQVGFNLAWYDLPLRRFATMKRQFPEVGSEIVTFVSQGVADFAGDFLDQAGIAYDGITYQRLDTWVSLIPFRDGLMAIYDSNSDRLDKYGQVGRAVVRGSDF